MKRVVMTLAAVAVLATTACGTKPVANQSVIPSVSASASDLPLASQLSNSDITIDCTSGTSTPDPQIVAQAPLRAHDTDYQIAIVKCAPDEIVSVESFVADGNVWASNGMVAGPDVAVSVTGDCTANETLISCPAQGFSEDNTVVNGALQVLAVDGDLSWTFIAE